MLRHSLFLVVIASNPFEFLLRVWWTSSTISRFFLILAMTTLGVKTNSSKNRQAGLKPFYLAAILVVKLVADGCMMPNFLATLLI